MAKGPCERLHPHLSAYADGTLPPKRWEQVSYHVAGCEECRDEVAAINAVCSKLSSYRGSETPEALAARLESIAGEHGSSPLYMAAGDGELPSARRKRVRRATQGGVALLAVMVSAVVLAVLVAPSPTRITDPVKAARELYGRSLIAISVNEAQNNGASNLRIQEDDIVVVLETPITMAFETLKTFFRFSVGSSLALF